MPVGIIINCLSVFIGGMIGSLLGDRISDELNASLNMIFGLASMGMGISGIVLMQNMPAVIFALILGTASGIVIHLGDKIRSGAKLMQKAFGSAGENDELLLTAIVLFCASGTGIYGSIVSGMNGDHSILISKSILDLFTALIFACTLKKTVSVIALPQFAIMTALFLLARVIYPLTTPAMINDFKACGGFIMVATGFRILNLKMFPTPDMIPAMILVMPLSALWMMYILPLVS